MFELCGSWHEKKIVVYASVYSMLFVSGWSIKWRAWEVKKKFVFGDSSVELACTHAMPYL